MSSTTIPSSSPFIINEAIHTDDLIAVADLFRAYATSLQRDLSFQNFATELAQLPGSYAPPKGVLLIAQDITTRQPLGCVGVRLLAKTILTSETTLKEEVCEMKRLYVTPDARGTGLGNQLANQAIAKARELGYSLMRLDTLSTMEAAQRMYATLGFQETSAYYETPLEDTVFLELRLRPSI